MGKINRLVLAVFISGFLFAPISAAEPSDSEVYGMYSIDENLDGFIDEDEMLIIESAATSVGQTTNDSDSETHILNGASNNSTSKVGSSGQHSGPQL